jgi:hypothetical protein
MLTKNALRASTHGYSTAESFPWNAFYGPQSIRPESMVSSHLLGNGLFR